jgi:hypothetical protein
MEALAAEDGGEGGAAAAAAVDGTSPAVTPRRADSMRKRGERQRPLTNAGRYYYFVGVRLEAEGNSSSTAERAPFVGLQLGLLLGKGSYGRVYKGYYRGRVVAVKARSLPSSAVCPLRMPGLCCCLALMHPRKGASAQDSAGVCPHACKRRAYSRRQKSVMMGGRHARAQVCDSSKVRRNAAGTPMEVDLTAGLAHPNLVRAIDAASVVRSAPAKLDWELPPVQEANESAPPGTWESLAAAVPADGHACDELGAAAALEDSNGGADQGREAKAEAPDSQEETWLLLEYCDQGSLVVR